MEIYICSIGLVVLLAYIYDKVKINRDKALLYIVMFLILFVVMGFRYGVGQDYFFTYVPLYMNIYNGVDTGIEIGFEILNRIGSFLMGADYQSIFIITSALFLGCVFIACKKNDANLFLMMYIFLCGGFYFYAFNVVRQCLATAFFSVGLFYISSQGNPLIEKQLVLGNLKIARMKIDENMVKYFLLMCVAASIHISSLLYFPLWFFSSRKFRRRTYFGFLFVFLLLIPYIFVIIGSILSGTKYGNYISGYWADTSKRINVSQILNAIIFFIYLFTPSKKEDPLFTIYMNIHYIGLLATCLMGVVPLVFRVTTLFYLIQFLSVPYYYKNYISKKYKSVSLIAILSIYGALFINTLHSNGNNILPYAMNL